MVPDDNEAEPPTFQVAGSNCRPILKAAPPEFKRNKQASALKPFARNEERLGNGPFQDIYQWNAAYMKRLSADSLRAFRVNAGNDTCPLMGNSAGDTKVVLAVDPT